MPLRQSTLSLHEGCRWLKEFSALPLPLNISTREARAGSVWDAVKHADLVIQEPGQGGVSHTTLCACV